jgi:sortase (surface protein transpeptidase)
VKAKSSPQKKGIQRLKYYKPLFPRSKTSSKTSRKTWRVKSYSVRLSNRLSLQAKIRTFKTSPEKRSKKTKQIVFKVGLLGIQECALSYTYKKQINKKQAKKQLFMPRLSTAVMALGILGIAFFGLQMTGFGRSNPPVVNAQVNPINEVEAITEPEKLDYLPESVPTIVKIPAISVNTEIHEVGLLASGAIETPDLFSNKVGWYKYGPTPGELGPSVLVGHVDTYKGPSVFWNLSKLAPGDVIDVTRADGTTAKFAVSQITQYNQDSFQTDEVYGNIDYAGLRIITCGGSFNYITGRYSHNTVVFASLVL